MSYDTHEETWRQQRDGARCGCSHCASEVSISAPTRPDGRERPPTPGQSRGTGGHPRHGASDGCPVCASGARSHDLVVPDEDGQWQIRLL
jgi:hypothetical protein